MSADRAAASAARRALPLLDLTSLRDDDTEARIGALCAQARTPEGSVAAVCVAQRFVAQAADILSGTPVRVATVANFPAGRLDARAAAQEAEQGIAAGAHQVDLVLPSLAFAAGDRDAALEVVTAARERTAGATLQVILETAHLEGEKLVRAAADAALDAGADFLRATTGRVPATPAVTRTVLEAVRDHGRGGVAVAGGLDTAGDAAAALALADEAMGEGWTSPETFRLSAGEELLAGLLDALGVGREPAGS